MIEKTLLICSIVFSLFGFNSASDKYDAAIAKLEAGNTDKVLASTDISNLGFPEKYPIPTIPPFTERPSINASHYLIGDNTSGKIILESAASDRVPIASTTKIMTAIIALENYKLDDIVTVPLSTTSQNPIIIPTVVNLRAGERITVLELLHCVLIQSGNDSAFAVASHLSPAGDIAPFVALMNKKAIELGMKNTIYRDPAGLDDTAYSSAQDLFTVTRFALKNSTFSQITSTSLYTAHNIEGTISHQLVNSNRLVNGYDYLGAIGVKTGFTNAAGHCLVSAVERDGHTLIGVVLQTISLSASASADESRKLMDWAWNNAEWK